MGEKMKREELEKQVSDLIDKWEHADEILFVANLIKDAVKLGIRYGFEKGRETKMSSCDNDGYPTWINKYKSADEVIQELDKEQEDE